jgi:predicted dehydrogenase
MIRRMRRFVLEDGTVCQFNSSWCVRVRRDDLLTVQVDGTQGQLRGGTARGVGAIDQRNAAAGVEPGYSAADRLFQGWQKVPAHVEYDNAFKIQWELFLRHVALDEPFRWTLREGAKGVQLAELGLKSWKERRGSTCRRCRSFTACSRN